MKDNGGWQAGPEAARREALWGEALEGFSVPTPLPNDLGSTNSSATGTRPDASQALSGDVHRALLDLAAARQIPVSAIVEAAWALALGRASGERDVLFGAALFEPDIDLDTVTPLRVPIELERPAFDWAKAVYDRSRLVRE